MFSLLLAAAEKEAPLIDIDGTVLVQFAIFCVLAAVLYVLVFRPFLAVRDQRERGIAGARAEAKAMEERALAASLDVEAKLTRARQRAEDERMAVRAEGAAYERQVLGAAREAAHKAIVLARAHAKAAQEEARTRLVAQAEPLARQVAARILGRPV